MAGGTLLQTEAAAIQCGATDDATVYTMSTAALDVVAVRFPAIEVATPYAPPL